MMIRSFICVALLAFSLVACNNQEPGTAGSGSAPAGDNNMEFFGDSISAEGAIAAADLPARLAGKDSLKIKVTGTIEEVCQKKGCWMDMKIGNDRVMKVTFKDYGFFVPKDASGKSVIIDGYAYADTVSVAELRHYAEDAGRTEKEIDKITTPEVSISFEANGVIIKK